MCYICCGLHNGTGKLPVQIPPLPLVTIPQWVFYHQFDTIDMNVLFMDGLQRLFLSRSFFVWIQEWRWLLMLTCWKVIVLGSVPEQILVPMSIVNRPPSQVHFVTALQHRMICYVLFCVMVYSRHFIQWSFMYAEDTCTLWYLQTAAALYCASVVDFHPCAGSCVCSILHIS